MRAISRARRSTRGAELLLDAESGAVPLASESLISPAVAAWHSGSSRVILSAIRFAPELPEPLTVTSATPLVVRVDAEAQTTPIELRALLDGLTERGGPDSGQYLNAFTWENGEVALSLGTQDSEYLAHRAQRGLGVPHRFAEEWSIATPIRWLPTGFAFRVPALARSETLAICFLVAWGPATAEHDSATWYAVDVGVPFLTEVIAAAA